MKKKTLHRLSENYTFRSQIFGDRIFFISIVFFRGIVDIIGFIFMASVHTLGPALFFSLLFMGTPIPGGVKVFLVAFLTLGSCFLLGSLLAPCFQRIRKRKERLYRAMDEWTGSERNLDLENYNIASCGRDSSHQAEDRRPV